MRAPPPSANRAPTRSPRRPERLRLRHLVGPGTLAVVLLLLPSGALGSFPGTLSGSGEASAGALASAGAAGTSGAVGYHFPAPIVGVPGTLYRGPTIATTPSTFWSVDAQTSCASCIWTSSSVRSFLNQTPFTWVRYGQNLDQCNISANRQYSSDGVASVGCGYNLTALKNWCGAQTPRCHMILGLPGENNNSQEDAAIAHWIVATVGIQPDYWAIGNEPTQWTHYGIPWTHWKSGDRSHASALAYAVDVRSAIRAVRAVDPAARFIGVEAACYCNTAYFQEVGQVDGSSISAVAYHSYPSTGQSRPTVAQFYAPLSSSSNLSHSNADVRNALVAGCRSCAALPIFVNEYNAGPGWSPSSRGGTFANAAFLAASITEGLRANVSQLTVFNLQTASKSGFGYSLMNASGSLDAVGKLYSTMLDHLVVGRVDASRIATAVGGIYDVVTHLGSAGSVLVVNTNQTQTLALAPSRLFAPTWGSALYWASGAAAPVRLINPSGDYLLAPQSILLVAFHTPGAPIALAWHSGIGTILGTLAAPTVRSATPRGR